jgi:glycosyltransferase involved in cell wall biosynthesis
MEEINPGKIEKAEIAVGIPSLNEADSISYVVKQVDAGLQKYFKNKKAVIINADNNSPDETGRVFLSAKTKTPKIYLSTPGDVRGKGNALRLLFLKIQELGAGAAATVDADIKSITPEWTKCLLTPLLNGYDYITPVYLRDKNDSTITNNICYPLLYGVLGHNIRQPIGGDFGFSKKLVEYWLSQCWTEQVRNYGIDIFMTTNAIKGGFKIGQIDLGVKIHKPSAPKLGPMFLQVIDSFFKFLLENKDLWLKKNLAENGIKNPPLVCEAENKFESQSLVINCREIEKTTFSEFKHRHQAIKDNLSPEVFTSLEKMFFEKKSLNIDAFLWLKIVYEMFYSYSKSPDKKPIIESLRSLYFGRVASFCKETLERSQEEAELLVQKQARRFFEERDYLLSLFSLENGLRK